MSIKDFISSKLLSKNLSQEHKYLIEGFKSRILLSNSEWLKFVLVPGIAWIATYCCIFSRLFSMVV